MTSAKFRGDLNWNLTKYHYNQVCELEINNEIFPRTVFVWRLCGLNYIDTRHGIWIQWKQCSGSWIHYTKFCGLMNKKNQILCSLISIIVNQPGHNFAHAMTAELSWHVQNCDLTGSYFSCFVRLQDLVYELINSLWNGSLDIDWSVSSNVNFQENVSHECIVNMWAYVHSQCSKYFDVFKHDWLGSF